MRRTLQLLAILAALVALFSIPAPARAQRAQVDTVWGLPEHAVAITYCRAQGDSIAVKSVMDMEALGDREYVAEISIHEGQHRKDLRANLALCAANARQLLTMETRAYCTEVAVPIYYGTRPDTVYFRYLNDLLAQFAELKDPHVTEADVRAMWFATCGFLITRPDGTSVKP